MQCLAVGDENAHTVLLLQKAYTSASREFRCILFPLSLFFGQEEGRSWSVLKEDYMMGASSMKVSRELVWVATRSTAHRLLFLNKHYAEVDGGLAP